MGHSLTVIVATTGRKTLRATLESFAGDLRREDAVHVCMDGRDDLVRRLVAELDDRFFGRWYYHEGPNQGSWGHAVRNYILPLVDTELVWHLDDDDVAAPGALSAIRSVKRWTIFRMTFMEGHPARGVTCWRRKEVRRGDIGTPMIVAPPSNARFSLEYGGDFSYAEGLLNEYGEPDWDERVIAHIRPYGEEV